MRLRCNADKEKQGTREVAYADDTENGSYTACMCGERGRVGREGGGSDIYLHTLGSQPSSTKICTKKSGLPTTFIKECDKAPFSAPPCFLLPFFFVARCGLMGEELSDADNFSSPCPSSWVRRRLLPVVPLPAASMGKTVALALLLPCFPLPLPLALGVVLVP